MPKVQFTGQAHVRTLSAADFKSVGVDDQHQVKVCRADIQRVPSLNTAGLDSVAEVSDAAAEYLLTKEKKGDWTLVDAPEGEQLVIGDASASRTTGSPKK